MKKIEDISNALQEVFMNILQHGSSGAEVVALQRALAAAGFDPGATDGVLGAATQAAVRAFQQSRGLTADGLAGPATVLALGLLASTPLPISGVTVEAVSRMFPGTPVAHIETHLPPVLAALVAAALADKSMVLMALATIRAETAAFLPISEGVSEFNTSPGGPPFDLYDHRADLGNQGPPDGERFKGRGFVQLTGRANYLQHGEAIGLGTQLVDNPDLANDSDFAARLLASFLKSREAAIRAAVTEGDLAKARKLVNGGSHGLDAFTDAWRTGDALMTEVSAAAA
jgi:peptidoglycan L-alanyl-D-glutamate endopeptidase CwlK